MASSFSSPWPDPNSHVLSKIDFGVPLVELSKWLHVRDTFLGQNNKEQDVTGALALARDCKHPDAEWLTSIFEGKDVSTKEEAKEVFLLSQDDARAICFAWCLTDDREEDLSRLRRAAEMGNAFACSTLCRECWEESKEEAFRLAQLATSQHERDGFDWAGYFFFKGVGCEKNLKFGKENLLIAAELGHIFSADFISDMFDKSDPARWIWLGRAALRGSPFSFLNSFSEQVEEYLTGSENAVIVFLIGLALKGNIDVEKKQIFGKKYDFESWIGPANKAASFYSSQIYCARLAVDTWALVGTRLHLIKDMRIYIGKLIWEARFEANYMV